MTLADNEFGLDERGSEAIFKFYILIVFQFGFYRGNHEENNMEITSITDGLIHWAYLHT